MEKKEIDILLKKQTKLINAGNKLAERAWYTTKNYDGLHRLGSEVAKWIDIVSKLNKS